MPPAGVRGHWNCCRRSAWIRPWRSAGRISSAAANASAWPSPAPSPPTRNCWSATRRCRPWTRTTGPACWPCWAGSSANTAWPCCSSPTILTPPAPWPSAPPCWTAAAWSRSAPPPRSSTKRTDPPGPADTLGRPRGEGEEAVPMPSPSLTSGQVMPDARQRERGLAELEAEIQRLRVDVERLGRAERLQRALFAISDLASSGQDTAAVLRGLHEIVGRLMYAENFYIVRYSPESDTMRFIYFADSQDPVEPDPEEEIPAERMANSLTLALIRHGKPAMGPSDQVRQALGVTRDETLGPDSVDWLGVPMVEEGVVRGAVVVQSYDPEWRYTEEDCALLGYVAQHILTALARRDAQEELERRVDERTRE